MIMGADNLIAQVFNISPRATLQDLLIFFSYCGAVDDVQLNGQKDGSQVAQVAFRQPFALQTALLLDGARLLDQRIRVVPLKISIRDDADHAQNTTAVEISTSSPSSTTDDRDRKKLLIGTAATIGGCLRGAVWLMNTLERASYRRR